MAHKRKSGKSKARRLIESASKAAKATKAAGKACHRSSKALAKADKALGPHPYTSLRKKLHAAYKTFNKNCR